MIALLALSACDDTPPRADAPAGCSGGKCDDADDGEVASRMCVAVRGNGPLISAHFGALAQLSEEHGPVQGIAGGSSGSITSFVTESIVHNPLLHDCRPDADTPDEIPCTPAQTRARTALLYKSFLGYLETLAASDEALAFETLLAVRQRMQAQGTEATLETAEIPQTEPETDPAPSVMDAVGAFADILRSDDIRELLGDEALDLILDIRLWRAVWFAKDIAGSLKAAASFQPADHHMFIRPGVLDFDALARKLGRVASFYIGPHPGPEGFGYGPYQDLERRDLTEPTRGGKGGDVGLDDASLPAAILTFDDGYRWFLDGCAQPGLGRTWAEIRDLPVSSGDDARTVEAPPTCGELFRELVGTYRQEFREQESFVDSRVDDVIGAPGGVRSDFTIMTTTGVLVSDHAKTLWSTARQDYVQRRQLTDADAWDVDFETDVALGYWGAPDVLATVEASVSGRDDAKSRMFHSLGATTWAEILAASPAEPGLARGVELSSGEISVGGWSDPHPTIVLEASGACDEIVFVTKRGEEGSFARGVQSNLGGADLLDAFYDLDDPASAVRQSLQTADQILCTDWDSIPFSQPNRVFEDAFEAPLLPPGSSNPRGC